MTAARFIVVTVVAIAVASAAREATSSRAPASAFSIAAAMAEDTGAILYEGELPDLTQALIVVNADGKGAKWLVKGARDARWSPDGSKIAYLLSRGDVDDLWVTDPVGETSRRLVKNTSSDYSWSRDGAEIVFRDRVGEGCGCISKVRIDGSAITSLTTRHGDGDPEWSPDGLRIAFTRVDPDRGDDLYVMDADGGNTHRLQANATGPLAWSPDGRWIAFVGAPGIVDPVELVHPDGSARHTILPSVFLPDLVWAPDGTRLAVTNPEGLTLIIGTDGSIIRKIKLGKSIAGSNPPAWSPNGTALALHGSRDVWIVHLVDNSKRRLTGSWAVGQYWPSGWDPRGRGTAALSGTPVNLHVSASPGKTYVFEGRRAFGYVRRNGSGSWLNRTGWPCMIKRSGPTLLTGYGEDPHGGGPIPVATARSVDATRWNVNALPALSPHRPLLGSVQRRSRAVWKILDPRRRTVAEARGTDGPAAGLDFLALTNTC